jgi:hypothetical protein
MKENKGQHIILRIVWKVVSIISECNYAQRRMLALQQSPDRYAVGSIGAPDTYAEFLFRTSGMLMHEASARDRAAGRTAVR